MNSPHIASVESLGLDLNQINNKAISVVERLSEAGYEAYLVGGCVRDLILGLVPKDFDVATSATPEEVKQVFRRNGRIIGRRFKIVHVRFGYEVIEVATFRASAEDRDQVSHHEMSEGTEGQLLRDNVYGDMDEDVQRRDFTANALYLDPIAGEVIDYLGGIRDIENQQLVSIGDPIQRFREDPVRMLRVIRFAAKLGFSMQPEALTIIEEEGRLLSHVSPARLFDEVLKLFHGGAAFKTYQMLREHGLFKYLFPFTDQVAVVGTEGVPELALQNTDIRIADGKPVIPAFLFACMLWDPVKADAHILIENGNKESQAWRIAMNDALRDQHQYVAVPRRLAEIILDIWTLHFRLIRRNPRQIKSAMGHRRFRAAYDFLLLRTRVNEVDESVAEWWTEIQEQDHDGKLEMIEALNGSVQGDDSDDDNEPNFNSIEYQDGAGGQLGSTPGLYVPNANQPQSRERSTGKKKRGKRRARKRPNGEEEAPQNRRSRRPSRGGKRTKKASGGKQLRGGNNGNGSRDLNGQVVGSGDSAPPVRKKRRRRSKGAKRNRSGASNRPDPMGGSARYVEARPKDEVHQSGDADIKRVKVRRKKRVVIEGGLGSSPNSGSSDPSHNA